MTDSIRELPKIRTAKYYVANRGAFAAECFSRGAADAARRAGDDDGLAGEGHPGECNPEATDRVLEKRPTREVSTGNGQ